MIIDFHTHIFSPYTRSHRDNLATEDPTFSLLYSDKKAHMIGVEELLRVMEREEIGKAVICGFPWHKGEFCVRENDYLLECHQRYPERIIPFITIPIDEGSGFKELKRCVAGGAKGIGEVAPGTYGEELWDVKIITPFFDAIKEQGLPILLHCNEPVGHPYPGQGKVKLNQIQLLVQALAGMKVILAHMGGGFFFYELMPEIATICQGVYYDTAASPYIYDKRVYKIAISIIGPKRILFGSDYPLIPPKRYVRDMVEAGLSEEELEDILSLNAQRLLGKSL
jgi:predicted TIM-barrel fold metal-dependent hydrolase